VLVAQPSLGLGWPTVGWVHAAFRLQREFENPDLPREITTPTLVLAAGADRVVDTPASERFVTRMRAGNLIVIEGAQHEILMERDHFRNQFWAAFDAFVPGVEEAAARLPNLVGG
jgi:lysophospholipase